MTRETLDTLDKLFVDNNYESFISVIQSGSVLDKLSDEERSEFLPKLALAYFHTEQYELSTQYFGQICVDSQNPVAWFNLCTSSILSGEYEQGLQALSQAKHWQIKEGLHPEELSVAYMTFYAIRAFIGNEAYNPALTQLEDLAKTYCSIYITNTQFLYTKGIPSFDNFVHLCEMILPKIENLDAGLWINSNLTELDSVGLEKIQQLKLMLKQ